MIMNKMRTSFNSPPRRPPLCNHNYTYQEDKQGNFDSIAKQTQEAASIEQSQQSTLLRESGSKDSIKTIKRRCIKSGLSSTFLDQLNPLLKQSSCKKCFPQLVAYEINSFCTKCFKSEIQEVIKKRKLVNISTNLLMGYTIFRLKAKEPVSQTQN